MTLQAAFAEIDITPPPGAAEGRLAQVLPASGFLSRSIARARSPNPPAGGSAFVQLDISCRGHERRRHPPAGRALRLSRAAVMVSATHNHAGPAVASRRRRTDEAMWPG